jgi:adenylate kinase family enzyme
MDFSDLSAQLKDKIAAGIRAGNALAGFVKSSTLTNKKEEHFITLTDPMGSLIEILQVMEADIPNLTRPRGQVTIEHQADAEREVDRYLARYIQIWDTIERMVDAWEAEQDQGKKDDTRDAILDWRLGVYDATQFIIDCYNWNERSLMAQDPKKMKRIFRMEDEVDEIKSKLDQIEKIVSENHAILKKLE